MYMGAKSDKLPNLMELLLWNTKKYLHFKVYIDKNFAIFTMGFDIKKKQNSP